MIMSEIGYVPTVRDNGNFSEFNFLQDNEALERIISGADGQPEL